MRKAGCHVSTRQGYRKAAEQAVALGGNAFQYFPKNPRSIALKTFDRDDARRCAEWCDLHNVTSIAHGPYAVNPATEGEEAARMAACTLNDLEIAEACGSIGVVVHFGRYKGADPLRGYRNMIRWINDVASRWDGRALILLENQAGDHGPMGTTPEELVQIRTLVECPEKVGFCLDSCHLYASGQWRPGQWKAFAERAGKLAFWEGLRAIHLNDSKYPSGSLKDRHEAIGEGRIGEADMRELLTSPELARVPLFLETPAGAGGTGITHRDQLITVKRWSEEAIR
ncbi:deoxyribonuclease IV [Cohnella endophytica]|uniref:Deoxyribonuclease IV n=1 Tax=Cohnella endophytica TaxID=2419778 RepID=A0A494Y3P8_9BACL|nr:deoxyribonuclease IV [Cohnella endophytica]RKP56921.1 deoxyribonuclease IV [Cohnella endophytica]